MLINVFGKPNEQSQVWLSYAMAKKKSDEIQLIMCFVAAKILYFWKNKEISMLKNKDFLVISKEMCTFAAQKVKKTILKQEIITKLIYEYEKNISSTQP